MAEKEIWKAIDGYEGYYEVSTRGRVRSLGRKITMKNGEARTVKGRVLRDSVNKVGYKTVALAKEGRAITHAIHNLVAEAFLEKQEGLDFINHKDENKRNNRVENLERCTLLYNNNYGTARERAQKTRIKRKQCSSVGKFDMDDNLLQIYDSIGEAARDVGCEDHNITCCVRHYKGFKTCKGFKFRYILKKGLEDTL